MSDVDEEDNNNIIELDNAISESSREQQLKNSAHEFMQRRCEITMSKPPIVEQNRIRKIEHFDMKKRKNTK